MHAGRPYLVLALPAFLVLLPAASLWAQPGGGFDFLRRMDANGNGMIEPDEAQGRMGDFLRRMAENDRRLDPRRPIPIRMLEEVMQRQREQYSRDRDDGDRNRNLPSPTASTEPIVPGFGIETEVLPPPGFGDGAELFLVDVEDRDHREAAERFERYDRNRDGRLSRDEVRGGRWSDDPFFYDANHDDYLSPQELAVRYANRRLNDDDRDRDRDRDRRDDDDNDDDSRGSRFSRGFGGGGDDDEGRARSVIQRYDRDRDGKLSREEADQARWFDDPWQYDRNRDRYLTADELAARYEQRRTSGFGGRDNGGSDEGDSRPGVITASDDRDSYRLTPPTERVARDYDDLPGWFFSSDANGDGQVSMAEYAANWSDDLAEEFLGYDANGDGIITAAECDLAENGEGSPEESSSSRDDRDGSSREDDDDGDDGDDEERAETSGSGKTVTAEDVDPKYLSWAASYIKGYDKDGDGELSLEECAAMDKSAADSDLDGNGRVTAAELAKSKGG